VSNLLAAREAFVAEVDGQEIDIHEGDLVESDSPIIKKFGHLFAEPKLRFPVKRSKAVEQATRAPGEKR
jgi:hypothetical protein